MKIGDRVSYQGQPGRIVNYYERRHRPKAWALVEFQQGGHRCYILMQLLQPLEVRV